MNLSIDGLNTYIQGNASSANTNKLENTLNGDLSNASDEELMDVCKEFEAYFTEQMFKAMQKMVPESEDEDSSMGQLKDYFQEQMVQEYAKQSAEGKGLGIAQMMYEQMKRNYNI